MGRDPEGCRHGARLLRRKKGAWLDAPASKIHYIPYPCGLISFNPDGLRGFFLFFRGYIDESISNGEKVFCLSCLVGDGAQWIRLARDWKSVLDAKNVELCAQGREQLDRYHASDCSNLQGKFRAWGKEERNTFFGKLVKVLADAHLHVSAYSLDMKYAGRKLPFVASSPKEGAYWLSLLFMLEDIGRQIAEMHPNRRITLFHDRTEFPRTIADAFELWRRKSAIGFRFVTIASLSWEDCVALQPADLFAYESMKQSEQKHGQGQRNVRRSLEMLHALPRLGGVQKYIGETAIDNMVARMQA